ncbi:hypothetical protein KAS08_02700 [Candidatus Pacearchaeota archaeon]|nr:hypothetical protein [Candidatus Pacearchaeota archaeon]
MAKAIKQKRAKFRIVVHELAKKKTKTISLADGNESLDEIEEKIRKLFE